MLWTRDEACYGNAAGQKRWQRASKAFLIVGVIVRWLWDGAASCDESRWPTVEQSFAWLLALSKHQHIYQLPSPPLPGSPEKTAKPHNEWWMDGSLVDNGPQQCRSQKFVMEGFKNRGLIGAGKGGVIGEGVSLP